MGDHIDRIGGSGNISSVTSPLIAKRRGSVRFSSELDGTIKMGADRARLIGDLCWIDDAQSGGWAENRAECVGDLDLNVGGLLDTVKNEERIGGTGNGSPHFL